MPEPVKNRGHAAPPLKTKAEKRAEAKVAKARARQRAKRRQMLQVAGVVVIVLALIGGLVFWIGSSGSSPASSPSTAPSSGSALSQKPVVTAGTGTLTALKSATLIEGTGAAVQSGQTLEVNYVGVTFKDGKEFDSSWTGGQPFSFTVGTGNVIKGWDQGLVGVKVGSRVQLDIPADLAYGENPSGGQPAGALRFVVDVLSAA
ncbi:FKBP-type peptidyl-prolyl cis-trans isomerase [Actinoplanes bogorensis]|uniref:Peptidyl-prolyl cis-trans isomerase n=1 Tax=Paractinoplanes bogorensis TaxID=1610840 RepID=A0ABS5YMP7_9ACTN|nr:FKBP-type peptidyl-prolyl cis-trans isomerase [Actinoplanes bogorensis]MBU2664737.1 FKBP-type peptidyl-prolyl cis-trans isomerase [Actinoplanes bogorensis]